MKKIHYLVATVFGIGNAMIAPGTCGSLAGLIACYFLHKYVIAYVITFIVLFAVGVVSAAKVEEDLGIKDPGAVVIDEFACIFPAFFMIPLTIPVIITGFILYRIIDIVKVPPMKSIEKLGGGWGIMLDDLMAGIYTYVILRVLILVSIL